MMADDKSICCYNTTYMVPMLLSFAPLSYRGIILCRNGVSLRLTTHGVR